MSFGEELKKARVSCQYTQETLGKKINLERSAISKWERGIGVPSEEQIRMLEEVLQTTLPRPSKASLPIHAETSRALRDEDLRILLFLAAELLFLVLGTWCMIPSLFMIVYAYRKSFPRWVKWVAILVFHRHLYSFLLVYFSFLVPVKITVEKTSYVLLKDILY